MTGTAQTMAQASGLGARIVVLHMGHIDGPDPTWPLRHDVISGTLSGDARAEAVRQLRQWRAAAGRVNLEAAWRSLDDLLPLAGALGLVLGLENRMGYGEVLQAWELTETLERYEGAPCGYWHDVGHAEFLDRLGLVPHGELLAGAGRFLVGTHLHDTLGLQDHMAPGTGTTDFELLRPYLSDDTLRVVELHAGVSVDGARAGLQHLRAMAL